MYKPVFQSLNEAIKVRNTPDSFLPLPEVPSKDVIHRGYIRKTGIPIRYDVIPDGKYSNSGKHIYHFKDGNSSGFLEIDHKIDPKPDGRESFSSVKFEMSGDPKEIPIDIYRGVIVPAILHHEQSHKPDIFDFDASVVHSDDIIRRLGPKFDFNEMSTSDGLIKRKASRKMDPKVSRILTHIKRLNKSRGK